MARYQAEIERKGDDGEISCLCGGGISVMAGLKGALASQGIV